MKITSKWLEKQNACPEEKAWFLENFKKETTLKKLIEGLIKAEKWSWGEWLIEKSVNQKQAIRVAIFSAELSKAKARIEELEAGIQMHIDKATNKPNGLEGR